jgi:nucleoside-diphosphate-sugar epimerase
MTDDLVLLTGATGYLGYLTLIELIKTGYKVRAAVRSESKIAAVEATPSFKALQPSVEWVIVPDMTADGAYDEAVKGVKYIIHVASPIPTLGAEPIPIEKLEEYFLQTAPKGELGMLESAHRSHTVQRIVITSSEVAIVPFEYFLGTGDYSVQFGPNSRIPDVKGPFDFEFQAYSAGKAAALNASETWMASHQPTFDVISVLPGWIFGRDELVTNVDNLRKGSTNSVLLNILLGKKEEIPYNGNAVLGSDVAKVQVLALDPKIKGNQSFTTSIDFEWEDAIDVLKRSFPQEIKSGKLSTEGKQPTLPVKISSQRTEETFGFKFAPLEAMVDSVVQQYLELAAKA